MSMQWARVRAIVAVVVGSMAVPLAAQAAAQSGEALFNQRCAQCHLGQAPKAPSKPFLQLMPADAIAQALISGIMQRQSAGLSNDDKRAIAHYLSGQTVEDAAQVVDPPACAVGASPAINSPVIRNWGVDARASRLIPAATAQLQAQDIPRLKFKWALSFHGAIRARSQPTFGLGMMFVGSQNGTVFALDPATGCLRWKYRAGAEVRTPVVLGLEAGEQPAAGTLAFFGDIIGRMYAVNAASGKLVWKQRVDDHPSATLTGAPVYHAGRLYVPVSSLEEAAVDAKYPCCNFRGSLQALNAATGAQLWKTYTIDRPAKVTGKTATGIETRGPSGAPIWNSPSMDLKRGLLYVGTGNNYSWPATSLSDSVVAFDMATGKIRWHWQSVANDAWNVACMLNVGGCPDKPGPDFDIGAGTILLSVGGRDVIAVGRKDGTVFALDAEKHDQPLWQNKLGRGSIQGGVQFAMAWDQSRLYVPIADMGNDNNNGTVYPGPAKPGLYAVNPATGALLWAQPADDVCAQRPNCDAGILAAVTAIPGAVFAGHMDGRLRAYGSADGKVLWSYDTTSEVTTLSGAKAHGGSMGGPGPMVYGGMVYVNSGYGLYGHMPGNVLLAFSVDGR